MKLSSSTKLPLKTIIGNIGAKNGSESKRFELAEKLTEDFFQSIKDDLVQLSIPLDVLEKHADETFAGKVNVRFKPLEKGETTANAGIIYNSETALTDGIKMHLNSDSKGEVNFGYTYAIMHEFRHLCDMITNPKLMARSVKRFNKFYDTNGTNNSVYKDFLYSKKPLSETKESLDKIFDTLSFYETYDEIIDFLQHSRYSLKSEYNAYKRTFEYQDRMNNYIGECYNCKNDRDLTEYKEMVKEYDFENKIKYLNEQLAKVLKNAREEHKMDLKG